MKYIVIDELENKIINTSENQPNLKPEIITHKETSKDTMKIWVKIKPKDDYDHTTYEERLY